MKQCNATKALEEFHGHVATSSVKAVVGCGCSAATGEVAKISYLWNITVVSNCLNMHGFATMNACNVHMPLYRLCYTEIIPHKASL